MTYSHDREHLANLVRTSTRDALGIEEGQRWPSHVADVVAEAILREADLTWRTPAEVDAELWEGHSRWLRAVLEMEAQ